MARLRLLLTLLATVFGFAWSAPVVHADAHIYDASVAERVDVQESGTISARTALVSAVREGSVPSARDAQGAPTTPLALENATNTGPVSKGPIADVEPSSLTEQLTLDEARSGLGRQIMENLGDEPRLESCYGAGEWVKMEWTHRAPTGNVTVHWFRNLTTGQNVEFKFK